MNYQELTTEANKFFQPYYQELMEYHSLMMSYKDDGALDKKLDHLPHIINMSYYISLEDQKKLAKLCLQKTIRSDYIRWDDVPEIRVAILTMLRISVGEYLVIIGKKKYRSLDEVSELN
jgi:hypothetical protein